jgi:hypothetical protein
VNLCNEHHVPVALARLHSLRAPALHFAAAEPAVPSWSSHVQLQALQRPPGPDEPFVFLAAFCMSVSEQHQLLCRMAEQFYTAAHLRVERSTSVHSGAVAVQT